MLWRSLIWFLCVVLISAPGLWAQEENGADQAAQSEVEHAVTGDPGQETGGSGAHAVEEGAPDIFAGDWITVILTLAVFIVLLLVLRKWAWGPILSGLQKREEHIRQSIEEAEKARADGEKSLAEYKEKLTQAQNEAQEIIDKGRADAVNLAEEFKEKALDEAQNLRTQAQRDITSAKDQALKQIYDQSVNLAAEMAGKIISKELDATAHHDLLQESLGKLQGDKKN
ncbi:F0F1 ATP synthase subunit B [Planctomycetota bacterium]